MRWGSSGRPAPGICRGTGDGIGVGPARRRLHIRRAEDRPRHHRAAPALAPHPRAHGGDRKGRDGIVVGQRRQLDMDRHLCLGAE